MQTAIETDNLRLLARLWLLEPDARMAADAASRLGLPAAEPGELAAAYADLFLLNVYPYGTVFTDPSGELNGRAAQHLAALYAAHGYEPAALGPCGAPDHLGACLGFAAHLRDSQRTSHGFGPALLAWAPVCCLAVEREPLANPFYSALAGRTLAWLLSADNELSAAGEPGVSAAAAGPLAPGLASDADDEVDLRRLVRFFLAPARCGIYLSRGHLGQMGRGLGLRLPFGSRFEVAEALFQAAGDTGQVEPLISGLEAEIGLWRGRYAQWAARQPLWPAAAPWLARASSAIHQLHMMRHDAAQP
jgi:TorA maturation chaperone TorD